MSLRRNRRGGFRPKAAFFNVPKLAALCRGAATMILVGSAIAATAQVSTNRPSSWARPLTAPGVRNFYQVTTNLYRGAQPTVEGMKQLKALGIKTVINLRAFHSDQDEVA